MIKDIKITDLDNDKVNKGSWGEYIGVGLCIARSNNLNFLTALDAASKDLGASYADLDDNNKTIALRKAMAEAILVDWKGFKYKGEEVPYSVENAYALLTNDPECMDYVAEYSMAVEHYLVDDTIRLGE